MDPMAVDSEPLLKRHPQFVHHIQKPRKFVISVDFGTTYSSVAYVSLASDEQSSGIVVQQLEMIDRFPGATWKHYGVLFVPTDIAYLANTGLRKLIQEAPWDGDDSSDESASYEDTNLDKNASTTSAARLHQPLQLSAAPLSSKATPWGYQAQKQLRAGEVENSTHNYIRHFKLLLDKSPETEDIRKKVMEQCRILKDRNAITDDLDVIADYLDQLFRCVKQQLEQKDQYKSKQDSVELALCVPASWNSFALRRMAVAAQKAATNSGLGQIDDKNQNLFFVSEPEAAAAYFLAFEGITFNHGEIFMVLDAGGGTVDAVTYKVKLRDPLRLEEVTVSESELCGSSFINERFRDLLKRRLKTETYLEQSNGETMFQIIDSIVVEFENEYKQRIDELEPENAQQHFRVSVSGLRENRDLGFVTGRLLLSCKEIDRLFRPSLQGVAKLMNKQFDATSEGTVEKIIVLGGFGQSFRLERYLREDLQRLRRNSVELKVYRTHWSRAAAARGGLLRALRKEDGPERQLQASYGFLRTEKYGQHDEHQGQLPEEDRVDGLKYIYNTIDWVLEKGMTVESEFTINRRVENTFAIRRGKLICSEILYVSDEKHPSHYNYRHPVNHGAEVAGRIEVDLTYLKDKAEKVKLPGRFTYRKVCFTLRITVNGRNLRFEVIPDGENVARDGKQVSIAAAFRPGTEDKHEYKAFVADTDEHHCYLTGTTKMVCRTPDATFGLATFLDREAHHPFWTYDLHRDRLERLMLHPKYGLIPDPKITSTWLAFPFMVYEAKGWKGDCRDARRQACSAAAAYLDILDNLARRPGPEKASRPYQTTASDRYQVFALTSFGAYWHVLAGRRRARLATEHIGPRMSKSVYIFERVWSGRITSEQNARQLLSLIDQIHNWAITDFRKFVLEHLKPWHSLCHDDYLLEWDSKYPVPLDKKRKRVCDDSGDLMMPSWVSEMPSPVTRYLQERAKAVLGAALIEASLVEGKYEAREEFGCRAVCTYDHCNTEFDSHAEWLHHLRESHDLVESELAQLRWIHHEQKMRRRAKQKVEEATRRYQLRYASQLDPSIDDDDEFIVNPPKRRKR